jgi:hypothetical protein
MPLKEPRLADAKERYSMAMAMESEKSKVRSNFSAMEADSRTLDNLKKIRLQLEYKQLKEQSLRDRKQKRDLDRRSKLKDEL